MKILVALVWFTRAPAKKIIPGTYPGPPADDWIDLPQLQYLMYADETDLCDTARPMIIKNQEALGVNLWNVMNWSMRFPTDTPVNFGFNTGPEG